jgi:DNA polymerase-3 subunit epsilon
VSPGRPIPESSTRFHGITDGMVADAPPIDVVLPAFVRFAAGAGLVGHEIWFDLRFLGPETDRLGLARLETAHAVLDTRLLSAAIHDDAADHDLDAVAARLGVSIRGRHSALGDALATAEVFTRLLALARHRGVATLGGMLDLSRRVRGGAGPDGAPR